MKKGVSTILLFVFLVAACQTKEVAPTPSQTPRPSATTLPTDTPHPTPTPTATQDPAVILLEEALDVLGLEGGGYYLGKSDEDSYFLGNEVVFDNDNEIAAWKYEGNSEWTTRFETLFETNEFSVVPSWIPLSAIHTGGGLEEYYEPSDEDSNTLYYERFSGQVMRIFIERIPFGGGVAELVWMSMTYGNEDQTIDVLIYGSKGREKYNRISIVDGPHSGYSGERSMWVIEYSSQEVLDALIESKGVQITLSIIEKKKLSNYASGGINSSDRSLRDIFLMNMYYNQRKVFLESLKSENFGGQDFSSLRIGYSLIWIFIDK